MFTLEHDRKTLLFWEDKMSLHLQDLKCVTREISLETLVLSLHTEWVLHRIMKWIFLACFVTFAISWSVFHTKLLRHCTKGFPCVPGPRGGSIIGFRLLCGQQSGSLVWKALYDMQRAHGAWYWQINAVIKFWDEIIGDIIGFNLFGHQMIVLNSYEVAKDMLEKNVAIYSDWPSTMFGKLWATQHSPGSSFLIFLVME